MNFTITPGRVTRPYAKRQAALDAAEKARKQLADRIEESNYLAQFYPEPEIEPAVVALHDLFLQIVAQNEANDAADTYAKAMQFAQDEANDALDQYQRDLLANAAAAEWAALKAKRAAASANPARSAGMYRVNGTVYRVQASQSSGRLYAKRLQDCGGFAYDSGAIFSITEADRMTLAECKAFGVETGICCVCAAVLTDPKSVAAGIGPVCAKRV